MSAVLLFRAALLFDSTAAQYVTFVASVFSKRCCSVHTINDRATSAGNSDAGNAVRYQKELLH